MKKTTHKDTFFNIHKFMDLADTKFSLYFTWLFMNKLLFLTALSVVSFSTFAKQIDFEKLPQGKTTNFHYVWQDHQQKQHELTFNLNTKNVNGDYRHFKALRPSLLHMYSVKKLKQAAAKLDPKKGVVKIHSRVNRVEYEIRSREQSWINEQSSKLSKLYESSLLEYLQQEYYTEFPGFHQANNSKIYKPDHLRFAKESSKSLEPVIAAIREKMPRANARRVAMFLLSWLQTIPYSTIESRAESNGSGFLPPIRLLANNKGDCDSKVTLMASIMKAMFPRLRIALVFIPGHAFIGMNVSHLADDEKLEIDGLDYTLSEPVGPGLLPFATISDRSKRYVSSGNYLVELL